MGSPAMLCLQDGHVIRSLNPDAFERDNRHETWQSQVYGIYGHTTLLATIKLKNISLNTFIWMRFSSSPKSSVLFSVLFCYLSDTYFMQIKNMNIMNLFFPLKKGMSHQRWQNREEGKQNKRKNEGSNKKRKYRIKKQTEIGRASCRERV